jgi:outer membrane protein assembly factor BamB
MIRALLLVLVGLVSACSSAKRENIKPPKELEDVQARISVQRLWSRSLGDIGGRPGLDMAATIHEGRLYAANTKGDLIVIDAASGGEISRQRTEYRFGSRPGVGEGVVAVGTLDGRVIVFDQQTGAERFSQRLTSEVIAAPAIAEGKLYVRSHDGRITAIDLIDGRRLWVHEQTVPALSLRGNASPRYDRGYLLVANDDGRVTALRADDGTVVWQQRVGLGEGRTDLERLADVDGETVAMDGVLYAGGLDAQTVAIDIAGGQIRWSRDLATVAGVAMGQNHLYVSAADGKLVALDPLTGGALWTQDALEHRQLSAPVVAGGYVAVGDLEGYVHWLDPTDGTLVARERNGRDAIRSAPVVSGDVVYVTTVDGQLTAYRVGS